jgi:hypothetical protein
MTIALNNERLTKKQVCSILQIGYSTLGRWMALGKIKFTREKAEHFESAVFFRRADLAEFLPCVTESVTEPCASDSDAQPSASESEAQPPVWPSQSRAMAPESRDIRTWAEKYKDGDAADSAGNFIHGANERWPTTGATLLGPVVEHTLPKVNRDTTSHMNPALVGTTGPHAGESYLNSLERQRDVGTISQATYDALTQNASKARRQCEQDQKKFLDKAAINAAFRHGYSR